MGYKEDILTAEKYINKHLAENITPEDVASQSGYSFFHFCHVFRAITGTGVAAYINSRRLENACTLLESGKSVTFTAMESGFNTVSGFTRAFSRVYGIPPSKYRASHLRISSEPKGDNKMEPEIIKKEAFKASCLVIKPESEIDILESGGYWIGKDIPELKAASHEEAFSKSGAKVGAWMHDNDGRELYYIYGDVLADGAETDPALKTVDFPAAEYAVFKVPTASTHEEFVKSLRATWKYIFNEWFDESPYKFDVENKDFEYYTLDGVYIYVPVTAK
jgi:AraC family transcriptional regulator